MIQLQENLYLPFQLKELGKNSYKKHQITVGQVSEKKKLILKISR